jgi:hypothetical protein
VVGGLALGILEWPYGLDHPYRPRVRLLGAVSVLQRGKKRQLVRLRVSDRCRLSPSGFHEGEGPKWPKGQINRSGLGVAKHIFYTV